MIDDEDDELDTGAVEYNYTYHDPDATNILP
jgi:hypothetical protein